MKLILCACKTCKQAHDSSFFFWVKPMMKGARGLGSIKAKSLLLVCLASKLFGFGFRVG